MKLRDEGTGQLYECEYACDGINQDRYIKTGRMVVEDRSNWHEHHDLIVAWARGADIQWKSADGWKEVSDTPLWTELHKYRIKPDNSEEIAKAEKDLRWLENEVSDLKRKLAKLRG
jgi:hypothetical protein